MWNSETRVQLLPSTISSQTFQYFNYSYEYARVYSEENDFLSYQDCTEVRGEVFELPFGNSRVIISEILIQNINSYMETELIVLKGGLRSGRKNSAAYVVNGQKPLCGFYKRHLCDFQFHDHLCCFENSFMICLHFQRESWS